MILIQAEKTAKINALKIQKRDPHKLFLTFFLKKYRQRTKKNTPAKFQLKPVLRSRSRQFWGGSEADFLVGWSREPEPLFYGGSGSSCRIFYESKKDKSCSCNM